MKYYDLRSIWICKECRSTFSFRSDVEEHVEKLGHSNINEYDMISGKLLGRD
ncbi:MAG: hypothetical protein ACRD93_05060 [Nitrososphaeraceae archaeon]